MTVTVWYTAAWASCHFHLSVCSLALQLWFVRSMLDVWEAVLYLFSSILLAYSVTQDGCWLRQINSSFFSSFSVEIHLPPITRQKDIHATRDGVAGRAREERPLGTSWRLCCRVALILKFPDRVTVDLMSPCSLLFGFAACRNVCDSDDGYIGKQPQILVSII